jgi:stearoyl-CoA desaturase (delta-9 desaturase)
MLPRSQTIAKNKANFNLGSLFSAFIYPAIGLITLISFLTIGGVVEAVDLKWWYLPLALGVTAFSIFLCNAGIGPLHRILQHKAGELRAPGQVLTMVNLVFAMQGTVREWVNYHSQHHRFADEPGDPHNPKEGLFWAWVGWILWRDETDNRRPMAMWLKSQPVIVWMDRFYHSLSVGLHLGLPALIYLIVWLSGGSLVLTGILHACVILGRAIQFHATVYGINVLGHLPTPKWADYAMALLTGGEAFHDHHHDEPQSALHLPRKGFWNRLFDYNGTILLAMEKIGWVRDLKIAPRFA